MLFNFGRLRTSDQNILDVLDSFCGRKNARLGVNGNPGCGGKFPGKYRQALVTLLLKTSNKGHKLTIMFKDKVNCH